MKLSNLQIKNFKSFENVSINLNDFNVIIGACASGKSNFIEIFKFLSDIAEDFERAISKHGGEFYLKNFKLNTNNHPCYIKTSFRNDKDKNYLFPIFERELTFNDEYMIFAKIKQIDYEIEFNLDPNDSYNILNEVVKFSCNFYKVNEDESKITEAIDDDHKLFENSFYIKNSKGKFTITLEEQNEFINENDIIPNYLIDMDKHNFDDVKKEKRLIINSSLSSVPISWASLFKNMQFYDFHPKLCKSMGLIGGEPTLTEQGDNLPIILDNILKNKKKRRQFLNLLKNLLPYVNNIEVEKVIEERRVFTLFENYTEMSIPAPLVSDGTSDIIAIIAALYFEKGDLIFIEEPERNIHPSLLSKIVHMMKEASNKKQIIITTHSPEVLKSSDLNDIFLISRNSNGYSVMSKPINNKIVKPFIAELGIDEVYIDDYLGLGNE